MPRPRRDPGLRFFEKVQIDLETECWLWMGSRTKKGYGQFWLSGRPVRAHRWLYELFNGPIPEGMQAGHFLNDLPVPKCSRACVNPDHLKLMTNQENASASPRHRENARKVGRRTGLRHGRHTGLARRRPENAHLAEGVYFDKPTGRYYAQAILNGKYCHLGYFDISEEAGEVAAEARAFERGFRNDVKRVENEL